MGAGDAAKLPQEVQITPDGHFRDAELHSQPCDENLARILKDLEDAMMPP
jgi:hypothetical protein